MPPLTGPSNHLKSTTLTELCLDLFLNLNIQFTLERVGVVYFDQFACACVCMIENDKNDLKLSKTYFFHNAYKRLM